MEYSTAAFVLSVIAVVASIACIISLRRERTQIYKDHHDDMFSLLTNINGVKDRVGKLEAKQPKTPTPAKIRATSTTKAKKV